MNHVYAIPDADFVKYTRQGICMDNIIFMWNIVLLSYKWFEYNGIEMSSANVCIETADVMPSSGQTGQQGSQ